MFGQPSRGLTRRRRASPKFAIARAAAPMFSPSCGSTRITVGPAISVPFLVLSVPAPGIANVASGMAQDLTHPGKRVDVGLGSSCVLNALADHSDQCKCCEASAVYQEAKQRFSPDRKSVVNRNQACALAESQPE